MFNFGDNWASFSRQLDKSRIDYAIQSLNSLFGNDALKGKSFLDIGCGSGLFSIAAAKLGCKPIIGTDVDLVSVQVSQENVGRWLESSNNIMFRQASVLNIEQMNALGKFDIVYSWGVLHHTGSMYEAIRIATKLVKPSGRFVISIYNHHWSSGAWWIIKWLYNHAGTVGQKILIWVFTPIIFTAKWLVTFENPLKMRRGMDFMHNVVDWVGGYPYEYASMDEIIRFLNDLDFEVSSTRVANTPIGCNEFVFKKVIKK